MRTTSKTMPEFTIEAILFDFDNTLLPTDQLRQQLSEKVLIEMNAANVAPGCCRFLVGITEKEGNEIIQDRFKIDALKFRERRNFLENKAIETGQVKAYPFVRETLQYIKKRNIPWGIVTQSSQKRILDYVVQRKLFGEITIGVLVGRDVIRKREKNSKPHPDPYLIAADLLNIAPRKCLVVEDSDSGVQAGLAANMQVIWFNNQFYPLQLELQKKVNYIVNSFNDILDLLKKSFG